MDDKAREIIKEEDKEDIRQRTPPRKRTKRRFDSGPDPTKVREEHLETLSKSATQLSKPTLPSRTAQCSTNDKHAKRAYIGNIPYDTDTSDLECFLNVSLREAGGCLDPGNPILNSNFVNLDKRFMFVELRSVEETTCLMKLDGINYRNFYLKIRRPVDYDKNPVIPNTREIPELDLARLGIISTQVEESELKLFVGGLAVNLSEDKVIKVLQRYGKLKSFHLVKEPDGVRSKGYAF